MLELDHAIASQSITDTSSSMWVAFKPSVASCIVGETRFRFADTRSKPPSKHEFGPGLLEKSQSLLPQILPAFQLSINSQEA